MGDVVYHFHSDLVSCSSWILPLDRVQARQTRNDAVESLDVSQIRTCHGSHVFRLDGL